MGFFRRLRASSGARKHDPADNNGAAAPAAAPVPQANGSAIKVKSAYKPYRDQPGGGAGNSSGANGSMAPPRLSVSSATSPPSPISTRSSIMPWKRDKKQQAPPREDFQSIPYESTVPIKPTTSRPSQPPPSKSPAWNSSVPSLATESPSPPPRSTPRYHYNSNNHRTPSYIPTADPSSPSPSSNAAADRHARTASHASQATVISLSSTFTGGSTSEEWEREGGPLGKLPFESSDDWGGLTPSLDRSGQSSKRTTPSASPSKQGGTPSALAMSPTPKRTHPQGVRKLGSVAPTAPPRALPTPPRARSPSIHNAADDLVASPVEMTPAPAAAPTKPKGKDKKGKDGKRDAKTRQEPNQNDGSNDKEEMEEIRTSEADDERKRFWKSGMRSRRTSRSSRAPDDRPVSMSQIEARPQLRRPSSSLFHNPFGRTQSRVSLAFDLEAQNAAGSAAGDDGSFQLKSFRHISGASETEGGSSSFQQYVSLVTKNNTGPQRETTGQDRSTSNSTIKAGKQPTSPVAPTSPSMGAPRPRPPSAAGSESSQRLSVAAFRKGVRRSSSTMLADDDDDMPLSLSRANLGDVRRDSSALSLTDQGSATASPRGPKRELPRAPGDESASRPLSSITTSSIGLGSPPIRSPRSPTTTSSGLAFVVKGPRPAPRQPRDAPDIASNNASLAAPPAQTVEASPKVARPPRKSSLRNPDPALTGAREVAEPEMPWLQEATLTTRAVSRSPPPPAPNPLKLPEPQATLDDLNNIKLPPRPDELPDAQPLHGPPASSRGGTLSPSFSIDPLRRISGLWGGNDDDYEENQDDGKEDAFDPMAVEATMHESPDRDANQLRLRPQTIGGSHVIGEGNRQSLYDRLTAATTSLTNALPTGTSEDKLHIPPPRTPSPPPINESQHTPSSERTASPVRMPPVLSAPPAPPPMVPHSSFGRVPRRAAEKPGKDGWASSSDEEDAKPKQQPVKVEPPATAAQPAPALVHPKPILQRPSQNPLPKARSDSDSEDEPLKTFKTRQHSRPDLQQMRTSSSRSSFKTRGELETARVTPQPPSRPSSQLKTRSSAYGNLRPSASNWSLSSSPDSPDSEELVPPVRPRSRASSHNSARPTSRISQQRPASRISLARNASSDQLRSMAHSASTEKLRNLPHSQSNDRLRPLGDRRHHAVTDRPSASPASSQSGLTGDSSTQQPMTPRSTAELQRRSWATESSRPRADIETASTRVRPSTHFDQMSSAGSVSGSMSNYGGGDGYGQPAYKQQFQAQWMAAAQRHFEDMWERASSVSNAQTLPNSHDMFQPTYGYSYSQPPPMPPMPMPQMPHMFGGGYPQYPQGYGGYGAPQVAFPGMGMPGMPMQGMHGMPPGMPPMGGGGGGMFSYGPGAQSVYGGEFGPPVAPGMREGPGSGSSPPSPRRQRGSSGTSARPASVAAHNLPSSSASAVGVPASHYAAQRNTPPRRGARRGSTLALSEAGGPPTAWRTSMGDDMETPRPRRVANAT